jgi:signal transduction histidine kinase/ActR/RegA family two-component response regulator
MLRYLKLGGGRGAASGILKGLGACAVGVAVATLFALTTLFERLGNWLYDSLQSSYGHVAHLENVVVLDVDEESLRRMSASLGSWRNDREVFAAVVRYLQVSGARAVAFHMLLSDERPGDEALAEAIGPSTVLAAAGLPVTMAGRPEYEKQLASTAAANSSSWIDGPDKAERIPHWSWAYMKLPAEPLTARRRAPVGVVNLSPDEDGMLRRIALFHGTEGYVLPSLPIAVLAAADPAIAPFRVLDSTLQLRRSALPLSPNSEIVLRFPANTDDLRVIPLFEAALAASGAPASQWLARDVAGKIIFIGSSSSLAADYAYTPVGRLSGVQVAAIAYATLAAGQFIAPAGVAINGLLLLAALSVPFALIRRGLEARALHYLMALVALPFALAAAGAALYGIGYQPRWLFALVAGLATLGVALALWLYALSEERRRLRYEALAAQQANRLKSDFLAQLTHELRTPLTAIMGFNKLNQFTDDLGRESRVHNSGIIARNCEHLLALINNNLDMAKIEAGTLVIAPAPEDPEQLLRNVIATMRPFADEKRLRLRFTRETPLPAGLMLDAFRVRQVLINLLSNALKFTSTGSVELTVAWHVAALVIEVRDTGSGIPAEALERIFEPFEQADASIAQRYGGTGLGLSITRRLVELMGGTIEVESQLGLGSVFRVRIPSEPAARAETVRPIADALVARERLAGRVLLAEDNADIRVLVERYLVKLGIETRAVANGFSAVEAALSEPYDVVLLDMEMPVMNGYEAVHVLRTRGYSGPILALTAHSEGIEVERARSAGCDGIVNKPTTLEALRGALAPHLAEGEGLVRPDDERASLR